MTFSIYKCTFNEENPQLYTQHLYICTTCKFQFGETICESCAKLCHSGHNLIDIGYRIGYCRCGQGCKWCHCFCKNPVPNLEDIPLTQNRQCTFYHTGHGGGSTSSVKCNTCHFQHPIWVCQPCLTYCHKDHRMDSPPVEVHGYCCCFEVTNRQHECVCKIHQDTPYIDPLPVCTAFTFDEIRHQKCFYCTTCDPTHDHPICESCYRECHKGHQTVSMLSNQSFKCSCCNLGKCNILASIEPAA